MLLTYGTAAQIYVNAMSFIPDVFWSNNRFWRLPFFALHFVSHALLLLLVKPEEGFIMETGGIIFFNWSYSCRIHRPRCGLLALIVSYFYMVGKGIKKEHNSILGYVLSSPCHSFHKLKLYLWKNPWCLSCAFVVVPWSSAVRGEAAVAAETVYLQLLPAAPERRNGDHDGPVRSSLFRWEVSTPLLQSVGDIVVVRGEEGESCRNYRLAPFLSLI